MNTTRTPDLPELSEASVERIEKELFARLSEESRSDDVTPLRRARSRRRTWLTVGGVAAAFAAGVLITPPLLDAVSPTAMSDAAIQPVSEGAITWNSAADSAEAAPERAALGEAASMTSLAGDGSFLEADPTAGREIIASGHASVHVRGVAAAADEVAAIAASAGGYVESTDIGQRHYSVDSTVAVPPGGDYGWVTIRVPSASLTAVIAELSDVGEVRSSSVSRHDVTSQAIDLRARVDATRASVERLTELMGQTGTVSELIEAEMALSERQAQLESYEQQLAGLEEQVAMSSLSVELVRIVPVTQADPAGFADGFKAGWNGLIVSLNALVIAAGFVIPWLAVAGAVLLVIWSVRRVRRRRAASSSASAED